MKKVTAIFDIGKSNKKFFLFDEGFQEVYREYAQFDPVEDEDGHSTEDLRALQRWIREVFDRILQAKEYDIVAINFSTYGASLVHLDENGEVLTPLYNYTKPLDQGITASFFKKYGPEKEMAIATGSPNLGMLNSGMQLYWLKHAKPDIFKKIRYSLHLPQYISYMFTGIPISEYTSIGCHTAMWDYAKKDYHRWIYSEGLHKILPPIVPTETSINKNYNGNYIKVGVGIHDSSAALLPYLRSDRNKFILVSTGTWSVAMNPFSQDLLTTEYLENNCIDYMGINGKPVKSARLFLGNEYNIQTAKLAQHFGVPKDYHKRVRFDPDVYFEIVKDFEHLFKWESFSEVNMPDETQIPYDRFEHAYHHLMTELVMLQVQSIKAAAGGEPLEKLYVDGGFSDNNVYIQLLSRSLRDMELHTTNASLGSALGAALVLSDTRLDPKFLERNYSLKKHVPFIMK